MNAKRIVDPLPLEESFLRESLDELRSLSQLVTSEVLVKKSEIAARLALYMTNPDNVRRLYNGLEDINKSALQEAVHHPQGELDLAKFSGKYRRKPNFGRTDRYTFRRFPNELKLFFPGGPVLPSDLLPILKNFVPAPAPLELKAYEALPAQVPIPWFPLDRPVSERITPTVRETLPEAEEDLRIVWRMVEQGQVQVTAKSHEPTNATQKMIAKGLKRGDWFKDEMRGPAKNDASRDLHMKAFAWPMLLQAGGIAEAARGGKLQISAQGRQMHGWSSRQLLHWIWDQWSAGNAFDEMSRIEEIRGQKQDTLTDRLERKQAVIRGLRDCPPNKWIAIDEFFRLFKATDLNFEVARDLAALSLGEHTWSFPDSSQVDCWEILQGRYIMCFLMEYAATLGLIDIGFSTPVDTRNDFEKFYGEEDISCLSRYDGLLYFRLNDFGMWCLGLPSPHSKEPYPPSLSAPPAPVSAPTPAPTPVSHFPNVAAHMESTVVAPPAPVPKVEEKKPTRAAEPAKPVQEVPVPAAVKASEPAVPLSSEPQAIAPPEPPVALEKPTSIDNISVKLTQELEIVLAGGAPPPSLVHFLNRIAGRTSASTWKLENAKVLLAHEEGIPFTDVKSFLTAQSKSPLPEAFEHFFADLERRASQIRSVDLVRLIEFSDISAALLAAHDPRLRERCEMVGTRKIIFKPADEPAVRQVLRELGYALPKG